MYPCCVRVIHHFARTVCGVSSVYRTPVRHEVCRKSIIPALWRWSPFCTASDNIVQTPEPKKKKQGSGDASFTSVGRKVPHRRIQVISETGEDLGIMSRPDVFRMMDRQGLRLVLLNQNNDTPVYKLMSGRLIHEEQVRQREQKKAHAAPVQVKELTLSLSIASHDLTNKLKQVESWLEKKHHIRISLKKGHAKTEVSLDTTLEQMLQQIDVMFGFVSQPKVIRDGHAAMCVIRPPSAKELAKMLKNKVIESKPDEPTPRKTATDKTRNSTEEPMVQQ